MRRRGLCFGPLPKLALVFSERRSAIRVVEQTPRCSVHLYDLDGCHSGTANNCAWPEWIFLQLVTRSSNLRSSGCSMHRRRSACLAPWLPLAAHFKSPDSIRTAVVIWCPCLDRYMALRVVNEQAWRAHHVYAACGHGLRP